MRIALTYNLRSACGEDHAEFDTRETIDAIAAEVESLGHHVTPLDVTGAIPRLVAGLRWIRPDLVLNLAEGERGTFREAFYPALFEQLGYPYTGSSPSTLALCLDKALAKRIVAAGGVAVPRGQLVRDVRELAAVASLGVTGPRGRVKRCEAIAPVIVKPNFEGASKGITAASVVTAPDALAPLVGTLLDRYPTGVVVEEYVAGTDVAVGWVDGIGLLPAIAYRYEAGRYPVYDFALKHEVCERVSIEIPARLGDVTSARVAAAAARAFGVLGVAGLGRADFRVTPAGEPVFLEMNPLPSLAPEDLELYGAAAQLGKAPRDLFAALIDAAMRGALPHRAVAH